MKTNGPVPPKDHSNLTRASHRYPCKKTDITAEAQPPEPQTQRFHTGALRCQRVHEFSMNNAVRTQEPNRPE